MTDESLEVVRNSLLSVRVPELEQVIITTCEHEATILGQVKAGNSFSMAGGKLTQVDALKATEAVESHS
jgi:hypothetical protein